MLGLALPLVARKIGSTRDQNRIVFLPTQRRLKHLQKCVQLLHIRVVVGDDLGQEIVGRD